MTDGILLNEMHHDRDAQAVRHDHHRRGARAQPQHRLPARLPQAAAAAAPRPQAHHHVRHDRPAELRRSTSRCRGEPAPIIEVSGRTYPVEIRYRPLVARTARGSEDDTDDELASTASSGRPRHLQGIADALDELSREAPGDVLVFLSGENEIRDAEDAIRGRNLPGTEVLPLYGRLSAADQHRVFQRRRTPGVRRRVVLATNVAETSLTVPGIRYVIDAGTARISRYSARSKVQRLPIEAISQASARPALGPLGPHQRGHRDPVVLGGGLRAAAPSSPIPRSCARTSPPSSCR